MMLDSSGPTSRIFFSQRLRLHYVDWGNPGGSPLLLVHGGRDHCRNWDWVAGALRRDWHVLAPDLRGHGDSQWSPDGNYTIAGYLYDLAQRMQRWIDEGRALSARLPRRYASLEDAFTRMREANAHLSPEQARHLTQYGVNQNEDGSYSWKFDNYVRAEPPYEMTAADIEELWRQISCPTFLVYGQESWASNPLKDGRTRHFRDAKVIAIENAGHWVHHDRLDAFLNIVRGFL